MFSIVDVPQKVDTWSNRNPDPPRTKYNSVDINPSPGGGNFASGLGGLLLAVIVGSATVFVAIVTAVVCVAFSRGKNRRAAGQKPDPGNPNIQRTLERDVTIRATNDYTTNGYQNGYTQPPPPLQTGFTQPQSGYTALQGGYTSPQGGYNPQSGNSMGNKMGNTLGNTMGNTMGNSTVPSRKNSHQSVTSSHATMSPSLSRKLVSPVCSRAKPRSVGMVLPPPVLAEMGEGRPLSISELPPPPDFLLDTDIVSVSCLAHDIPDGYRSGDSVDDDIDDVDFRIRAPSFGK